MREFGLRQALREAGHGPGPDVERRPFDPARIRLYYGEQTGDRRARRCRRDPPGPRRPGRTRRPGRPLLRRRRHHRGGQPREGLPPRPRRGLRLGKGESVNSLIADPPRGAPVPPILPPRDGFLFLDRDQFAASFAADIPVGQAAFMADSQVPRGVDVLSGAASQPAWRTKPTWYLVATDDRMIPPPAQRAMAERAGPDRRGPRQPLRLRLPARRGRRSDQADRTRPTGRPRYGGHAQRPHTGAPARTADARSLMTRGTGQRPATIGPPSARPAAYLPQRLTHTGPATRAGRGGWRRPLSCPRAGDVRQSPGRLAATPGGGKALETEVVEGEAKLM